MKPWKPLGLAHVVPLALALSVLAACDDDAVGPGDTDPVAQAQALEDVTAQFFTDNEAVQSLNVLALPISAVGFDIAPVLSVVQSADPPLQKLADGVWAAHRGNLVRQLGDDIVPDIPTALLNTQWQLNEQTLQYELDPNPDPDRPANGVRFLLYAVDPILGLPVTPLQEIGYLDLIDTSTLPTLTIQMIAVIQGTTLIDLTVSATIDQAQSMIDATADGFISDGMDQLAIDFDLGLVETSTTDFTLDASLVLTTGDITVTGTLTAEGTATSESFTLGLSIVSPDGSISFSITVDGLTGDVDGEVRFASTVVALITGNVDGVVNITNAEGGELTEAELAALESMFEVFFVVFEGAAGILFLILVVFGFALV